MTEHDLLMMRHAKARGPVIVTDKRGTRIGTLTCWRPRSDRRRAYVRFLGDTSHGVSVDAVSLPAGFTLDRYRTEVQS